MSIYKKAIEVMNDSSKNTKDMLVWIAKNHPSVFVNSYMSTKKYDPFIQQLKEKYEWAGRIAAVKMYREKYQDMTCQKACDEVEKLALDGKWSLDSYNHRYNIKA